MTLHSMHYFMTTFALAILSLVLVAGCANFTQKPQVLNTLTEQTLQAPEAYTPHPDWIGLQLAYAPFEELRKATETSEKVSLKSRGEAHITILSPPEFKTFQGKLPMPEIEAQVKKAVQSSSWTPTCVGRGKLPNDENLKTYFVVVQSPDLLLVRQKIKALALAKGVGAEFNPDLFYPHVTLGFTERDLHLQDGVIKDSSSCLISQ